MIKMKVEEAFRAQVNCPVMVAGKKRWAPVRSLRGGGIYMCADWETGARAYFHGNRVCFLLEGSPQ